MPDLYEAAEAVILAYNTVRREAFTPFEAWIKADDLKPHITALRAALAKARGEQPTEPTTPRPGPFDDFAPPVDPSEFRHPFEPVQHNPFCNKCGAGKLHPIHQGGTHAR